MQRRNLKSRKNIIEGHHSLNHGLNRLEKSFFNEESATLIEMKLI
jgi:hypothetical protein